MNVMVAWRVGVACLQDFRGVFDESFRRGVPMLVLNRALLVLNRALLVLNRALLVLNRAFSGKLCVGPGGVLVVALLRRCARSLPALLRAWRALGQTLRLA